MTLRPPAAPAALDALKALLDAQRDALVSGEVATIDAVSAQLRALLADPAWQRAAQDAPQALRALLAAVNLNAGLAARGDAQAARTLSMLGATPALYTAAGGLGGQSARGRGVAA